MPGRPPSAWDALAFLDELLLLAVLAIAGAGLPSAVALRVLLAVALPVAAAVAWGMLLAPRASRRLTGAAGFSVKIAVFTVAAALLAVAGPVLWAVLFWVASVVVWSAVEFSARRNAPEPAR